MKVYKLRNARDFMKRSEMVLKHHLTDSHDFVRRGGYYYK